MNKPILYLSVLLFLQSFSIWSQVETPAALYNKDTVQFELTKHNNISIESILNEKDTIQLMFHTAVNSVSLTPDQSSKLKDLDTKSSESQSWSGTKDIAYLEGNNLEISKLEWNDVTVWLNLLSGHETAGKFGPNLFGDKVIEIDFDESIIVLHKESEVLLKGYETFELSGDEHGSLFIEGDIQLGTGLLKNKFLIHSGYGSTIILDDAFCKRNEGIKKLKVIDKKELKDSLGNIIKTNKAMVSGFRIFNFEFEDVPISYFDSELEIQHISVLGVEILKRFNMMLDVANMKLHVKPNANSNLEFKA